MDGMDKAFLVCVGMILGFILLIAALMTFKESYKISGAKLIKYDSHGSITEIQK